MTADLLCFGEPMLELNEVPAAPEGGQKDGARRYLEGFGGDTSNTAIAAARQGARVGYATAIGHDTPGERLLALWRAEGIDTSTVLRNENRRTALYLVTHGAGGHSFSYWREGSAASAYAPADVPVGMIERARMVYASGISQAISTSAADAVFHAIERARSAGVTIAYDTNYRPRLWPRARAAATIHAALAMADIALPGLEDATALTGLSDADAVADFYLRLGPQLVVVKCGSSGAVMATPAGRVRIPPFACTPVDATGAGDAFNGAFLARVIEGDAPEAAARYAAAAAALSTEGYGAVAPIPRREAVLAALAR